MNTRSLAFAAITLLGIPPALAANPDPVPKEQLVLEIIRNFNPPPAPPPKPVTLVLDAVGQAPPATDPTDPTDPTDRTDLSAVPAPAVPLATPRGGLTVRVENLQAGNGISDIAQVKLLAPFPAKPLAFPPAGWRLQAMPHATPFTREVELAPGHKVTLSIRPDLLVPDADGNRVFSVPEPGFDPALGYRQTATVGTILANSIQRLDHDAKALGAAIDQLQQILVSLPKPADAPDADAAPDAAPDASPDAATPPPQPPTNP